MITVKNNPKGLKTSKKVILKVKAVVKRIPTASTRRAIDEAKNGKGKRYDSLESFKKDLKTWS